MLVLVGYSPEAIQALYRIGDSSINILTPLMPYFPVVIAFGQQYDPELGIGRLIALMLPYSLLFLISWLALFFLWLIFDLPYFFPKTTQGHRNSEIYEIPYHAYIAKAAFLSIPAVYRYKIAFNYYKSFAKEYFLS